MAALIYNIIGHVIRAVLEQNHHLQGPDNNNEHTGCQSFERIKGTIMSIFDHRKYFSAVNSLFTNQ
jgi:hypothetical protein